MQLNETQKYLLKEQYDDRIGPCIREILRLAKSDTSKEVCVYLILKALKGTLNQKQYTELLTHYLNDLDKQIWLKARLISLNNLFQPENNNHLFIRFIIDDRFYSKDMDVSHEDWIELCKKNITDEYTSKIHAELSNLCRALHDKMVEYIDSQQETAPEINAEITPENTSSLTFS